MLSVVLLKNQHKRELISARAPSVGTQKLLKLPDGEVGKGAQACMSTGWMGVKSPCLQLIKDTNNTRYLNETGC